MVTEGELLGKKKAIEERKLGLEKYQAEIRRIQVEIVCLTYRRNSAIAHWVGHDGTIRDLKKELKSQMVALKRDYGITDRLIPHQMTEYDLEIFRIKRQLAPSVPETATPPPPQPPERSCGEGRDRSTVTGQPGTG